MKMVNALLGDSRKTAVHEVPSIQDFIVIGMKG